MIIKVLGVIVLVLGIVAGILGWIYKEYLGDGPKGGGR